MQTFAWVWLKKNIEKKFHELKYTIIFHKEK